MFWQSVMWLTIFNHKTIFNQMTIYAPSLHFHLIVKADYFYILCIALLKI